MYHFPSLLFLYRHTLVLSCRSKEAIKSRDASNSTEHQQQQHQQARKKTAGTPVTTCRKFCNRRATKETPLTKGMPATSGTLVTEEKEATVTARRGMLAKVGHQQDQVCL
jgi:hypothetical protein